MIWTFYSYKGGVGRSMALANVAEWLYLRGLRVVMIDWDLEAPGLERFFRPFGDHIERLPSQLGLIDLLGRYRERLPLVAGLASDPVDLAALHALDEVMPPLDSYVHPIHLPAEDPAAPALSILPAGARSNERFAVYAQAVQDFDWSGFYARDRGELFFAWLRWRLLRVADVVLIDSRTGISEMSGPGTRQLADIVVSICAPNHANLDGVITLSNSFVTPQLAEARGRKLDIVIVPSRIENSETDARNRFESAFRARVEDLIPRAFRSERRHFWDLRIPYIPKYAFDEELAIGASNRAEDLEQAYERLATGLLTLAPAGSRLADVRAEMLSPADAVPLTTVVRPAIWSVPPRDPLFFGRARELDELRAALAAEGSRVAIVGLAGIGKTALATEYAHRFGSSYRAVLTSRATSDVMLRGDLRIQLREEVADPLIWLERHDGWLLLLDDPDPQSVAGLLAGVAGGHVIVTSRSPAWSSFATSMALSPLSPDVGAELLLRRSGSSDGDAARALSAAVGGLPLALRVVADYGEATGRGLDTISQLLRDQPERVLQRSGKLATAFDESLKQATRADPNAATLLTLAAYLAHGEIPLDLLARGAVHLPDALRDTLTDPLARDAAVIALRQSSLVTSSGEDVIVHPVVRMLVPARLDADERTRWETSVLRTVADAYPVNPRSPLAWEDCARLRPHALAVAGRRPSASPAIAVELLVRVAAHLEIDGQPAAALDALQVAERLAGSAGADMPQTDVLALERALLHLASGDIDRAGPAIAVLLSSEKHRPPEFRARLELASAAVQWARGEAATALDALEHAFKPVVRPGGPELAMRAALLLECGRLEAARAALQHGARGLDGRIPDGGGDLERIEVLRARMSDEARTRPPSLDDVAAPYAAPVAARYAQIHLDRGEVTPANATLTLACSRLADRHPRLGALLLWRALIDLKLGDRDGARKSILQARELPVQPLSIRLLLEQVDSALDTHGVRCVAFSPDGTRLATCGDDPTAWLWSSEMAQKLLALDSDKGEMNAIAFSPDGGRCATASVRGAVELWDPGAPSQVTSLEGHVGAANAVAFAPDGRRLATGGDDGKVLLWSLAVPIMPPSVLGGHQGAVRDVAFLPDGAGLVSVGADGWIRLWSVETARRLAAIPVSGTAIHAVAVFPDGSRIAAARSDGAIVLWDGSDHGPPQVLRGHKGAVNALAFAGARLVSAGDDRLVKLWDLDRAEETASLAGHVGPVRSLASSPDGQRIASAGDGTVRIWDLGSERHVATLGLAPYLEPAPATSPSRPIHALLRTAATDALECIERYDLMTSAMPLIPER